jgi:CheY-like chemotaxis protein
VALMGGRLELESTEGVGSRFSFSLAFPRATAASATQPAPAAAPADLHGVRVLVAEDDPVNQLLARELLSRRGAGVTVAANGAEAVAAVSRGDFDVVLMDIRMPEMDGLTAYRHIRALPGRETLPILALTANALAEERARCLAAGMDGYLTKPLEPEILFAELHRQLRSANGGLDAPRACASAAAPPGFDAQTVQRWQDTTPGLWQRMARAFIDEHGSAAAAIGAALDAGNRAHAGYLLHRLRGAAGTLGAVALSTAAERLERALGEDGPIDAGLRQRLNAAAEAVLAALAIPAAVAAAQDGAEPDCAARTPRLRELQALLEAGNTRALDHLPWLERCADAEASGELRAVVQHMEALDFPAALRALSGHGEDAAGG